MQKTPETVEKNTTVQNKSKTLRYITDKNIYSCKKHLKLAFIIGMFKAPGQGLWV